MDVSYMLFLMGGSGVDPEPTNEPDEAPITKREPEPPPNPMKPAPATPDANPIDPRVGQPW